MEFSQPEENNELSLTKFESMLKTNNVLFFDSSEFENIIYHYLENGKVSLAKKAIKLGLEQHPSSVNLRLFKTEIYIIEDKLDEADKLLESLHELEPNNEEIYIQKANLFSKRDEHQKAVNTLLIALEMAAEDDGIADLYSLIGMEYLFLDQFENAQGYFKKCLEIDNQDYSALYNVIYCYDFLNNTNEAIVFLNDYLNGNPYCEVAWHQLGCKYYIIEDYEKALVAFDFAIISDDTFVGAYLEKGKVLEKKKLYNEAISNYKITLELEDPTSFALLRIGKCHERLGNKDLAVQYYYKTVHEDPLLDKGWIAITKFYNKEKNYQKALFYINKAINIDGENVVYWKLYAQINHRLNFIEEAERGYKKALDLGNYELSTWLARADILIALGEYEASVLNLIQTAEFYPETPEIEFRLAGLYFTLHESSKGHYHLKNALLLNKDFHYILEELFPKVLNKPSVKELILEAR
ncbi:MAG: tetratricopeptide repeat protein [Bacteroidota bacterium]